jgi:methylenetetrahydrofolate--tRNA-(uracil-5-)-methyltransferase
MTPTPITIIGAGLAGCEAAYQIAERGIPVILREMKPIKRTPAHSADGYAELVCSNSLRSNIVSNAVGLLKEELRRLNSLIMQAADATAVPAGSALAVDRHKFSAYITNKIKNHPLITIVEGEVTALPQEGITVVAGGPLTSEPLSNAIAARIGERYLHFYDAAAPIVSAESIDMGIVFAASRYGRGEASYLNCPFTKEEYDAFYDALITAETAHLHEFEANVTQSDKLAVFEGCLPIEVMAARGKETLLYGPMKPVGLPLPSTGRDAHAIVQLRMENAEGSMYNLVGFQTHLTFGEQRRVLRLIPGLANAEFLRYGVMHRNTFINSPGLLSPTYRLIEESQSGSVIFFAGQMTGVEGYVESTASGWLAGVNAAKTALGEPPLILPRETMIGAMAHYVAGNPPVKDFQPMNANFGIIAALDKKVGSGKRRRDEYYAERSLKYIESLLEQQ